MLQTLTPTHPKDFMIKVTIGVMKETYRSIGTISASHSDKGWNDTCHVRYSASGTPDGTLYGYPGSCYSESRGAVRPSRVKMVLQQRLIPAG